MTVYTIYTSEWRYLYVCDDDWLRTDNGSIGRKNAKWRRYDSMCINDYQQSGITWWHYTAYRNACSHVLQWHPFWHRRLPFLCWLPPIMACVDLMTKYVWWYESGCIIIDMTNIIYTTNICLLDDDNATIVFFGTIYDILYSMCVTMISVMILYYWYDWYVMYWPCIMTGILL